MFVRPRNSRKLVFTSSVSFVITDFDARIYCLESFLEFITRIRTVLLVAESWCSASLRPIEFQEIIVYCAAATVKLQRDQDGVVRCT